VKAVVDRVRLGYSNACF